MSRCRKRERGTRSGRPRARSLLPCLPVPLRTGQETVASSGSPVPGAQSGQALGISQTRPPDCQGSLLPCARGGVSPGGRRSRPPTTTAAPCPSGSHPGGHPAVPPSRTSAREVGGPCMPVPPSVGGAGPAAVAQPVRVPGRRVPLALRRCRQRPSMDRWALDFKPASFRHRTRVVPSPDGSVFCRSRLARQALVPSPLRVQVSR